MKKTKIRHICPGTIELFYLNHKDIGFVSLRGETIDSVNLHLMRITHGSQRKGYGTILMNEVIKLYGNKTIKLKAEPHWDCDLKGLVRFFQKFGFKTTGWVHKTDMGPADYATMVRRASRQ